MRKLVGLLTIASVAVLPAVLSASPQTPGVPAAPVASGSQSTTQEIAAARRLLDALRTYLDQGRVDEFKFLLQSAAADLRARQEQRDAVIVNPPAPPAGTPVRIGGSVEAPRKIRHVDPRYPASARAAGVQGRVILEVIVNEQGDVASVRVLRSIPDLDDAAVEAVSAWRYTPTSLNGVVMPVIMTVTVDFALQPGA